MLHDTPLVTVVEGGVGCGQLAGAQHLGHQEVARQIPVVALSLVHALAFPQPLWTTRTPAPSDSSSGMLPCTPGPYSTALSASVNSSVHSP